MYTRLWHCFLVRMENRSFVKGLNICDFWVSQFRFDENENAIFLRERSFKTGLVYF
jgi:hypothetical protein